MRIFKKTKFSSRFFIITSCLSLSIISCSPSHSVQTNTNLNPNPLKKTTNSVSNTSYKASTVEEKLSLYLQLLQSTDLPALTYLNFISSNPTWPNQNVLANQMQKALLNETNKNAILTICKSPFIKQASALTFCAQQTKISSDLIEKARKAWIYSITLPTDEQEILSVFQRYFTPQDQWKRFDRLENAGLTVSAARQIRYLSPDQINLAQARLAFKKNQLDAERYLNTLSSSEQKDTGLIYNRLRWLRLQNRQDEALQLWQSTGLNEELKSGQKRFWSERNNLIRDFLNTDHPKQAFSLITNANCNQTTCRPDEVFLGGWIQLRKFNNALKSINYFNKLTQSHNLSIKTRGLYWLGRAYQANQNNTAATQAWKQAAIYPTTFYGQLSIAHLNHLDTQNILLNPDVIQSTIQKSLAGLQEPSFTKAQYNSFKNNELIQAVQILIQQDDLIHARPFLLAYNKLHSDIQSQAINVYYANQVHLFDNAVTLSRQAAVKGSVFLKNGWPRPYAPLTNNNLPRGLSLAIMRQESSFNPIIVSHAHAYGLMQLLPSTAKELCRRNNIPLNMSSPGNLTVADNNIRLGTIYLTQLMKRFNNNLIYTIASYNAGPNRVKNWIDNSANDPTQTQADLVDWIEMIPFTETRNYVQHVMENLIIYQTNINQ